MSLIYFRKATFTLFITLILVTPGCASKAETNSVAPDFTLQDLSGRNVSLSDYKGKPVLLDFWATWCHPCRASIPELVDLYSKYKAKGLVIIGVSVDNPNQVNNRFLTAFVNKYKIDYIILRSGNKVMKDYFGNKEVAIPTMFVINREGMIKDKLVGFKPGAVENSLRKIIR